MAHTDDFRPDRGQRRRLGLGAVASLAGRLRLIKPWCDVWLVATGAEERVYTGSPDHLGALALARRARAHGARKRLRFALSLDEVGRDRPFWLRSPASVSRPKVEGALLARGRARRHARQLGPRREHRQLRPPRVRADRPAGREAGRRAGGEPCRHMACDRPSRLDPKSLRPAKMAAEALRSR